MTTIVTGLFLAAFTLFIWGDYMRAGMPKLDLILASAAAAPMAAHQIAGPASAAPGAIRFFTAPLWSFTWEGLPVFMTVPDTLALGSSFILAVRFIVWVVTPFFIGDKRESGERDQ